MYKYLLPVLAVGAIAAAIFFLRPKEINIEAPASSQAFTVDLKKFVNVKLNDTLGDLPDNNLANVPAGLQDMANVPFDISGVTHLAGISVRQWGRTDFPEAVTGIPVNRACQRLFILHGAGGATDPEGTTIAKLRLRYSDNTLREIEINVGEHVRDWWGDPTKSVTARGSDLAWSGLNPAIEKRWAGAHIRIYKSAFLNPKPNVPVVSVDYLSTMKTSASFLLGLTVD